MDGKDAVASKNLVVEQDSLVHNLLKLGVLQVVPHHHLQNLVFPLLAKQLLLQ